MKETRTLANVLEDRWRDDDKSAAWHVQALSEMWETIRGAGLADQARDIKVTVSPPATKAEIAAYQALVPAPLPGELVTAWRDAGGAAFRIGERSFRWLSLTEILAQRDELRGRVRKSLRKYCPDIEVLALVNDQPLLLYDTDQRPGKGEDYWFHKGDGERYNVLTYMIAIHINLVFMRELTSRIGDLFRLAEGQRPGKKTQRVRLTKGTRYWEAILDGCQLLTRSAKVGTPGKPAVKLLASDEAAATLFAKAVKAADAKGYRK